MPEYELKEKRFIVMGASGGLGSRIASELAARGARLLLAARNAERLEALDMEGVRATADITSFADCERVVASAREAYDGIDGVINAAGVVAFGPLVRTSPEIVRRIIEVNTLGPLYLIQAALPHMSEGVVANISAIVVERPMANLAPYCAAKAALAAATGALNLELKLGGKQVRCIDVRPPPTETGLATRPIAGKAPKLPTGLAPERVAKRIVKAIENGETEIPSNDF